MKQTRARTHDCGGFARLLRAEFAKFRSVRAWLITLCAVV
jgi:hypothetical protein